MNRRSCLLSSLALVICTLNVRAEDWPQWRGPRFDGTSAETGIPLKWSATDNIAWKTPIPGKGHSSPIIFGDRIFVTSALDEGKQLLLCLDRKSGKILWTQEQTCKLQAKIHKLNSHASSTPATDGKFVFWTFHDQPAYVCCCYDYDGKLIWKKSPGEFYSVHGFSSPPILYKDLVILNGDQDDKKNAYLVALDKATGEQKWRADRPGIRSYCPPVVFDVHGKKEVIFAGSNCTASYDPDTGKQIWIIDGPTEQFVASAVYKNDVLFMTYGFPLRGHIGINPEGTGNITKTNILYNIKPGHGGYVPSPIAHGDYFFNVSDEGFGTCREAKTGELKWDVRMGRHHTASFISSGDYLYVPDDDGNTWVLKAGPKYELVQKNPIGEEAYASLAVSQGQIFLRGLHTLFCIGK